MVANFIFLILGKKKNFHLLIYKQSFDSFVFKGSFVLNSSALQCFECSSTESCKYSFEPKPCRYDQTICMVMISAFYFHYLLFVIKRNIFKEIY